LNQLLKKPSKAGKNCQENKLGKLLQKAGKKAEKKQGKND
jgi:hypothetical protein